MRGDIAFHRLVVPTKAKASVLTNGCRYQKARKPGALSVLPREIHRRSLPLINGR